MVQLEVRSLKRDVNRSEMCVWSLACLVCLYVRCGDAACIDSENQNLIHDRKYG